MDSCRRDYEEAFRELVGAVGARAFSRGRHGLLVLLKALGVGKGDRVGVCGYTCLSVVEPVKLLGAVPVYLDVDEHACIDPKALARQAPGSLKAVILQHTFGVPGRLGELVSASRGIGARVIEDCAHALGCSWNGVPLGSFGDGAIYSFGWGKPYTTGWGGMLTVTSEALLARADEEIARWALPERSGPELLFDWQRRIYRGFVKARQDVLLDLGFAELRRCGVIRDSLGREGSWVLRRGYVRLAGERTCLAGLRELDAWPELKRKRRRNTRLVESFFSEAGLDLWPVPREADVTLLAYPALTTRKTEVLASARRRRLDLVGGPTSPVYPLRGPELANVGYDPGSCLHAEYLVRHLVYIPTASSALLRTAEAAGEILSAPGPAETRADFECVPPGKVGQNGFAVLK